MTEDAGVVSVLSLGDLETVEAMRARNNSTLGFLPKRVLAERLESGDCLGVRNERGEAVGYLLFAQTRTHLRVIHLCIAEQARGKRCAKALVERLIQEARQRKVPVVRLNCRRDFPAHRVWPRLGFIPLGEKPAKTPDRILVHWYMVLEDLRRQGDLFHVEAMEDRMNAVVDAQVFFDLHATESTLSLVSKGLQADFLADMLRLFITDEMFNEIARGELRGRRETSLRQAHAFLQVEYDRAKVAAYEQKLRNILPFKTDSQISDIRQLAKTAASSVSFFITRDDKILKAKSAIRAEVGLQVLDPTEVIGQLHQLVDRDSYGAKVLSGSRLMWRPLNRRDLVEGQISAFLGPQEKKWRFESAVKEALAWPDLWHSEGLWSDEELVAIRAFRPCPESRLIDVGACRAARGPEHELWTEFVIASMLYEAVDRRYDTVRLRSHSIAPSAMSVAANLGFIDGREGHTRLCLTSVMSTKAALARLQEIGDDKPTVKNAGTLCSPCALSDGCERVLLVPIKPGYAQQIFDLSRAPDDLIGADKGVLLRWTNVYFRRKAHHHLITSPARILWYVSGTGASVVAVSQLDDVDFGSPKEMFREYRRMGALPWQDIYKMCRGEEVQTIMVLRFSHTFMFNKSIRLDALQALYAKHGRNLVVQSPSRVPRAVFLDIFREGFPEVGAAA